MNEDYLNYGNPCEEPDPIEEPTKEDIMHEAVCDCDYNIECIEREIENLNTMVDLLQTFSKNTFLIDKLNFIKLRIKSNLKELKKNCDIIQNYNA